MKIAVASDHAGLDLKEIIKEKLLKEGYDVLDCGTRTPKSVDYPVFGLAGARSVAEGKADFALLFCGTGLGMTIMANKVPGIRAVNSQCLYTAGLARSHNDANVLCLGGRVVGPDLAWEIVRTFLTTPFSGGRHQRRVNLIRKQDGCLGS
ncbi:MAG TPA: ribose 5-phosphate isomerase B [bacterium]|nr:ribose 5-phosphate isomerase B [bacterium]HNS48779.1 ribose 5-phosphate isomerase B [bacterium]